MKFEFKEIDVEDFIWRSIPDGTLSKRGLDLPRGVFYRQVQLGGCGVLDIVGIQIGKEIYEEREGQTIDCSFVRITVYELKRHELTCNDFGQISRYIDCLELNTPVLRGTYKIPDHYDIQVRGVLIGSGIDPDAFHLMMMMQGGNIDVMRFTISIEAGIMFENILKSKGFEIREINSLPAISMRSLFRGSFPLKADFVPKKRKEPFGDSATDKHLPAEISI